MRQVEDVLTSVEVPNNQVELLAVINNKSWLRIDSVRFNHVRGTFTVQGVATQLIKNSNDIQLLELQRQISLLETCVSQSRQRADEAKSGLVELQSKYADFAIFRSSLVFSNHQLKEFQIDLKYELDGTFTFRNTKIYNSFIKFKDGKTASYNNIISFNEALIIKNNLEISELQIQKDKLKLKLLTQHE